MKDEGARICNLFSRYGVHNPVESPWLAFQCAAVRPVHELARQNVLDSISRLGTEMKADTSSPEPGQELRKTPLVLESMGFLFYLIHTVIARRHPQGCIAAMLPFAIQCSAHTDKDLRALGRMLFLHLAIMHAPNRLMKDLPVSEGGAGPGASNQQGERTVLRFQAMFILKRQLVAVANMFDSLTWREKDKAQLFLNHLALANAVPWVLGGNRETTAAIFTDQEIAELVKARQACADIGERALLENRPDVRASARRLLTGLFLLVDTSSLGQKASPLDATLKRYANIRASNLTVHQAVQCLSAFLYACMDFGCPPGLLLRIIESLAPFGNARKYPDEKLAQKDVKEVFDAFLKHQQFSELTWKECKKKLRGKHLEMVERNKGQLRYFS